MTDFIAAGMPLIGQTTQSIFSFGENNRVGGGKIALGALGDSLVERFWPQDITLSSLVASNGVALGRTAAAHGMWPGLKTAIRGATTAGFNGLRVITSVPSSTTFTFAVEGSVNGSAGSGAYFLSSHHLYSNNSVLSYVQMLTNFQFDVVVNAGVSGERTDQVLQRVTEITDPSLGITDCLVLCGINDCTQNISATAIKTNLARIYSALLTAGIRVHARTLMGYGASSGATTAQISVMNQVNDYIRRLDGTPGIYVVDYHMAMVDAASATGLNLAANMDSAATVHPSPAGCFACATLDAASFLSIFPRKPNRLPTNQADTYNVSSVQNQAFDNPTFVGGATLATGWASSIGGCTTTDSLVARTVVADGDTNGNNQSRAYVNASGTSQTANLYQQPATSRFTAGDTYAMEGDAQLTGVTTAIDGFYMRANFTVDGIVYESYAGLNKITTGLTANDLRARIQTPPMIIPAGTLSLVQCFLTTRFNANGTPTLLLGRSALRKTA